MYRVHTLPTQSTKEESTEDVGNKEGGKSTLNSVEESLVLLQALRQSRQAWLTSAFVKFSTKSRGGKGSDIWQPPHTIRFRGKCDLEIGPHVFYATSVYEVTYQPYSAPVYTPQPYSTPQASTLSAVAETATTAPAQTPSKIGAPSYPPSATALVSSLKGAVPITSELIAQVNAAAVSNPTLANLLGLAASGSATPEQLQTLGVTIQSLAATTKTLPTTSSQSPVPPPAYVTPNLKASSSTGLQPQVLSLRPPPALSSNLAPGQSPAQQQALQTMQVIHKDPDVVIEFYENSYDRWILPKELVLYERVKRWDGNNSLADIIFSTIFPFEGSKPSATTPVQQTSQTAIQSIAQSTSTQMVESPVIPPQDVVHPITLRFFNVPPAIWNLFSQSASDEERTKRAKVAIDSKLDKAATRAYLQYRIADGPLLTQLQASASDRYPTKGIRPSASATSTAQGKRRTSAKDGSGNGPPKRKRIPQAKKAESRTGTCDICKRASIVLAPESPYCPPCTKKVGAVPTVLPSTSTVSSATDGNNTTQAPTQATTSAILSSSSGSPSTTTATASSPPKSKKQKPPAASNIFKHSLLQTPYTSTAIPSYYAWQTQGPYAYHYQHPHAHTQSRPVQIQGNAQTPQTPTVTVPMGVQQTSQQTTPVNSTTPTQATSTAQATSQVGTLAMTVKKTESTATE